MKKIITFIYILVFCVGLNSCAVYTTYDDYGRSGSCYHTHSIYYRPAYYPTRHYSRPKPKPYYRRPKPKPTHHPHSHRPHNSRDNHNNHNHNRR
jgi:hypothetical protein